MARAWNVSKSLQNSTSLNAAKLAASNWARSLKIKIQSYFIFIYINLTIDKLKSLLNRKINESTTTTTTFQHG